MPPANIVVIHREGEGCHGQNGADEVAFDAARILTRSWADYPILRIGEVPAVEVKLIDRPDERLRGVGEGAQVPTAGASATSRSRWSG